MIKTSNGATKQDAADEAVEAVEVIKQELGPFVVAAEMTRMPMLFIDAKSPESNIVYANTSFLSLTGYDKDEVIGLPFHSLLANGADRARATPEAIADADNSTMDLRCLRRDKSRFDAVVLASPVCDEAGKLQQYFLSVFELTKHVEKRLEEYLSEADIFRHTPGFIAFSDGPDHRFSFTNHAYEVLVGRSNLVGQRVSDAFPDQGFVELLDKVYNSGERVVGRRTPIRLARGPNGETETRYIDFIYEAVRDASGAVVGLFCEGSDITDTQALTQQRDQMQAQLVHVSRINAMGTMAATLAHEINQPLAAIANYASGCVHVIDQTGIRSEKLREGLSSIVAAAERAGKIIRRLRDMTKRTQPSSDIFDLSQALDESVHLVRAGGCENVSITTQCTPSLLVQGDKIQVQQVMINLLRNACHAAGESTSAGTVVAISTRTGGWANVAVCDNGPGLPAEMKGDPFQWTESMKSDGMGIGLSVSRTIAESHGGDICVGESGASGSTFTFSLPALATAQSKRDLP